MDSEARHLLGWATDDLVRLDAHAVGLIARLLTASPMTRQDIFTVLATSYMLPERSDALGRAFDVNDADLAMVLRDGKAREILAFVFDVVPQGWLGALERLGGKPLKLALAYGKLHSFFSEPRHRRKAKALQHVGAITERTIFILDVLDDRWMHAEALKRLPTIAAAKDFNRAVAFAQSVSSKATDEAIVEAIGRLAPSTPLSAVISRFVRRADHFPPHPVMGDDEIRPLASARDFIECARRYRNCLRTMLDEALAGHVAFAEFRQDCILEFRPLTLGKGWLLDDVHVEGNGLVGADLRGAMRAKCDALGIPSRGHHDSGEDWHRYRRFVRNGGWLELAA